MQIGIIGLGRMGKGIALRLFDRGHSVCVYNRTSDRIKELEKMGLKGAYSIEELISYLAKPRIVWLMLPAGEVIDEHINLISGLMDKGDIIIDGGNSYYKDDIRRSNVLKTLGIHYVDVGVSGGIWGLREGFCLMIGGEKKIFYHLEPIFRSLSADGGYLYCGKTGAGHFVKMIHNGIEYAIMQAYGEGFELINSSDYGRDINFHELARLWNRGSIIRSWLLELIEIIFKSDPDLSTIQGYVEDSGEGRWIVKEAVDMAVPLPTISLSLYERFNSRKENRFSNRLISALRKEFGGHKVRVK